MSILSSEEVTYNRLRLTATTEIVKVLARQGCSFRGNDESIDSLNSGNFDAILDLLKRVDEHYRKVLESGPKNATYRSPTIQKQIANILGNKVRAKIREKVRPRMSSRLEKGVQRKLWFKPFGSRKENVSKAPYTVTLNEKVEILELIRDVKYPSGYARSLGNKINLEEKNLLD
ncbi:hypothetical protein QQ045_008285 [Rhodiola kirilowii]